MGGMVRTLENRIRISLALAKLAKLSNMFIRDRQGTGKLPKCKPSSSNLFRSRTEKTVDASTD